MDKEVYLDAQSKGFVSRIVKYHKDNVSRNRNVYKSPGDLPIVHLKRSTDLLFKNRRSNSLSNLRVGRLDRNYGTEEIKTLQRGLSTYEDSFGRPPRDAPVAHHPIPVHALSGTRSALDELEEISRKRINPKFDGELDLTSESKKYCRDVTEVEGTSGAHQQQQQQQAANQKRQRNVSPPMGPGVAQQRVKKVCRDSYDVISSLSSSIGLARSKSTVPHFSSPTASTTSANHKTIAAELRPSKTGLDKLPNCLSVLVPVSRHAPPTKDTTDTVTTSARSEAIPAKESGTLRATDSVPPTTATTKQAPRLTLFNKDYNTIPQKRKLSENSEEEEEGCDQNPFVKPRERDPELDTRVEEKRRADKNKLALMLKCLAGDFEDSEEEEEQQQKPKDVVDTAKAAPVPAISFSLPKATETVTKSEVAAINTISQSTAITTSSISVTAPAKNNPIVIASVIKPTADPQPLIAQPTAEENVATKPVAAVTSTSISAGTGFNLPTTAMFTFNKTKTDSTPPATTNATLSMAPSSTGFKFGASDSPTLSTTSGTSTASAVPIEAPKSSIPGIFSFSKSPPAMAATTTTNLAAATSTIPSSKPSQPSKIPVPTATFSFGAPNPTVTAAATPAFTMPTITAPAAAASNNNPISTSFAFGSTPSKDPTPALLPSATTAFTAPALGAPSKPAFSFGAAAAVSTSAPTSTAGASMFSFGGSAAAAPPVSKPAAAAGAFSGFAAVTSSTPVPTFGSAATTTASSAFGGISNAKTFSFGDTVNATTTTQAPAPVFGASSIATTTPASNSSSSSGAFSFGGTSKATPVFGGASTAAAPTTTISTNSPFGAPSSAAVFGGGMANAAAPPAFGATKPTTATFGGGIGGGLSAAPVFGATQQTPAASAGSASSPFNFGGASGAIGATSNATTAASPFSFGGGGPSTAAAQVPPKPAEPVQKANTFSFGGASVGLGSSSSNNNSNNNFSTTGPSQTPFAFGGATGGGTSVFGGAPNTTAAPVFGGAPNTTAAPVFGGAPSTAAAPVFGGSASTTTAAASPFGETTFSFGGSASQPSSNNAFNFSSTSTGSGGGGVAGSAFKFGDTSASQPASSTFAFGQNTSVTAAGGAGAGMFNFGGNGDLGNSAGGAPAFSIGTGGGAAQQQRRPIRQATRRLK